MARFLFAFMALGFVALGSLALSPKTLSPISRYKFNVNLPDKTLFLKKLGLALAQNELDCNLDHLVYWNEKEAFPSLGIGHAIWFPADVQPGFEEGFPLFVEYLKRKISKLKKGDPLVVLPRALTSVPLGPAPWKNREEFLVSPLRAELQEFFRLPKVMEWQTEFMFDRTLEALHRILRAVEKDPLGGPKTARKIYKNIQLLLRSEEGVLSLIDYVNFKGSGLIATELSPLGQLPWGLKTVLEKMTTVEPITVVCDKSDQRHYNLTRCANYAFAEAAMWSLTRLAQSWGDQKSEERLIREKWLNGGWARRVRETYLPGALERVRCEF